MKTANPSFALSICAVNELHTAFLNPVTHLISIWDTTSREAKETLEFAKLCQPEMKILKLSFDDPAGDSGRGKFATAGDLRKALAFAESCGSGDHLLIHCRAGIARSPAIALAVLCQACPSGAEDACLGLIFQIRPQAQPDRGIVLLADNALKREGNLIEAFDRTIAQRRRMR